MARELLGKCLIRKLNDQQLVARIVEVEAYLGRKDPASHTYRGRTLRNEAMFSEGGHAYIYFTYGMHHCFNVVTNKEGVGEAVLIRAVEPLEGLDVMAIHRRANGVEQRDIINLCNGPAKLCEALAMSKKENGVSLLGDEIWIGKDSASDLLRPIRKSSRIGIRKGHEFKWRFYFDNNPFVSRARPAPLA